MTSDQKNQASSYDKCKYQVLKEERSGSNWKMTKCQKIRHPLITHVTIVSTNKESVVVTG